MPDPIFNKLGAYLDGELNKRETAAVEDHLKICAECRAELDELRRMSSLLADSPEPEFTPAQDFKSRLMLQLPRREDLSSAETNIPFLLWLTPVMVLVVLVFIQVTIGLTSLITMVSQAGLFNGSTIWADAAPRQMAWFTTVRSISLYVTNNSELPILLFLNDTGVFFSNLISSLLLQTIAAIIYWGILGFIRRRMNGQISA